MIRLKYSLAFLFSTINSIYVFVYLYIYGLSIEEDGLNYIRYARNIVYHNSWFLDGNIDVNTHYAPLYPVLLAAISKLFNTDCFLVVYYLNPILIFVTIFIFNLILSKLDFKFKTKLYINLLFSLSVILSVFLWVLTEPMFFLFYVLFLYLSICWIEKKSTLLVIFIGITTGLMLLTRYASVGIILGFVIFLTLDTKLSFYKRISTIIFYLFISFAIFSIWVYYTLIVNKTSIDREFNIHIISIEHIIQMFSSILYWICPSKYGIFVVFILFGVFVYSSHKSNFTTANFKMTQNNLFYCLMIFSYIAFLFVSISFFDFGTPLDNRILLPAYVPMLLLACSFCQNNKYGVYISKAILVCIFIFHVYAFCNRSSSFIGNDKYTGEKWKHSDLLSFINLLPKNKLIYTNGENIIWFNYFNKDFILLPTPLKKYYDGCNKTINNEYTNKQNNEQLLNIMYKLKTRKCVLIYFYNINSAMSKFYLDKEYLINNLRNYQIIYLNDGFVIY